MGRKEAEGAEKDIWLLRGTKNRVLEETAF
jgi:hypothetical protein